MANERDTRRAPLAPRLDSPRRRHSRASSSINAPEPEGPSPLHMPGWRQRPDMPRVVRVRSRRFQPGLRRPACASMGTWVRWCALACPSRRTAPAAGPRVGITLGGREGCRERAYPPIWSSSPDSTRLRPTPHMQMFWVQHSSGHGRCECIRASALTCHEPAFASFGRTLVR